MKARRRKVTVLDLLHAVRFFKQETGDNRDEGYLLVALITGMAAAAGKPPRRAAKGDKK